MTFGEKVRSLRKEKKMSQQELASMVGVSYRTIRSWEVEGRFPKQNVLYQKLADALQCDVSYLMSENMDNITISSLCRLSYHKTRTTPQYRSEEHTSELQSHA